MMFFYDCHTLNQRRLKGRNYNSNIGTWLRQRFNDLPIHQACYYYDYNGTTKFDFNYLSALIHNSNEEALTATDAMDMTALHILCCNPHATAKAVQLFVETDHSLLSHEDVTESTPLKLFLKCRGLLLETEDEDRSLSNFLERGIKGVDLDVVLILSRDLEAEVSNPDGNTGLLPFMSAATIPASDLDVMFTLAMRNLNAFL